MTAEREDPKQLPDSLVWLADAPMFIDANQIARFYDAVVKPETNQGTTTLEITEEKVRELSGKLNLEASASPTDLLNKLTSFLPFLKLEAKASVEGEGRHENTNTNTKTVELHPITTPQRQLVQLTLYYLLNNQSRLFLVDEPTRDYWRDPKDITQVPRQLVFLNLPSQEEARQLGLAETKIIPTAAEFENGHIALIYNELKGHDDSEPPVYPEKYPFDELMEKRREYWRWFDENFSATKAMVAVEKAASEHGRIRWIDYRVPVGPNGDTLHLHVCPSGEYDTGVLAYNFIKRGYKHGLRLVGTLKSEPDMNVLAIYDK